jgi:hypothetical protein
MKYVVNNLVIEVTRRCNMCCDHCLRGDAQALDLDIQYVKRLFAKISYIDSITFTGGEPSLVPHIIEAVLSEAKRRKIGIGNFYIATNAKEVSDKFLLVLLKLWTYCESNEISSVAVSNDGHHDYDEEGFKKLSALRFVGKKQEEDDELYSADSIIKAGRAAWNYPCTRRLYMSQYEVADSSIAGDAELYLNCQGNLIGNCNLSYEQQDDARTIVCNVETTDLGAACLAYNERVEEAEAFVNDETLVEA